MSLFAGPNRSQVPGAPGALFSSASPPTDLFTGGIPPPGATSAPGGVATGDIIRDGNNRSNQYTQVARVVEIKPNGGIGNENAKWASKVFAAGMGELVMIQRSGTVGNQGVGKDRAPGRTGPLGKGYERTVSMMTLQTFEEMTQDSASMGGWDGLEINVDQFPRADGEGNALFSPVVNDDIRNPSRTPFLYPATAGMTSARTMFEQWTKVANGTALPDSEIEAFTVPRRVVSGSDIALTRVGNTLATQQELKVAASGNKRNVTDVAVSGIGNTAKSTPDDRSSTNYNHPVKTIPSVAAQRSMRALNFGPGGLLGTLFRSFRPDGIVLGKFGSSERWNVDGSAESANHSADMQLDMQSGALYNIIVEGFGICSSFWAPSSKVFTSPQKYQILPRDKLFLLVIANKVSEVGFKLKLEDFVLVRASSADLYRMAGLVGMSESDGRYSTISTLREVFGDAHPARPEVKNQGGNDIPAKPHVQFDVNARIVGGWEIGSVTDNAAAEAGNSFALPRSNGKRQRNAFMSMQLNVNIKWIDSFELHERYWSNVEGLSGENNKRKRNPVDKYIKGKTV